MVHCLSSNARPSATLRPERREERWCRRILDRKRACVETPEASQEVLGNSRLSVWSVVHEGRRGDGKRSRDWDIHHLCECNLLGSLHRLYVRYRHCSLDGLDLRDWDCPHNLLHLNDGHLPRYLLSHSPNLRDLTFNSRHLGDLHHSLHDPLHCLWHGDFHRLHHGPRDLSNNLLLDNLGYSDLSFDSLHMRDLHRAFYSLDCGLPHGYLDLFNHSFVHVSDDLFHNELWHWHLTVHGHDLGDLNGAFHVLQHLLRNCDVDRLNDLPGHLPHHFL